MSALEPCPFCGGRAVIERWMPLGDGRIYCESCVTSRTFRPWVDDATATAAWNRRHVPEGFVLVPVEPNEAMVSAIWTTYTNSQVPPEDLRGITWEELARWAKERPRLQEIVDLCWAEARAMLAAAKEPK